MLVFCGGAGHVEDVQAGNAGVDRENAGHNFALTNRLFWQGSPIKKKTQELCAAMIYSYLVFIQECLEQLACCCLRCIFYSKIIYYKGKNDSIGVMFP